MNVMARRIIFDLRCMRKGKNGPSRFSYEILNALMKINHNSYYLVLLHPEWAGEICSKPRFVLYYTHKSSSSPLDFMLIYRLARQFKASTYFSSSFMTPFLTGTSKRVATVHDLINITLPEYFEGYSKGYTCLAKLYLRFRTWLTVRNSDKLVTVSIFSSEQIANYYGIEPSSIDVVYNGVSDRLGPKPISRITQQRYSINGPYVLGLANFRGYKNNKTLLRAYAELKRNGRKELLVLFGKYSDALAKQIVIELLGPDIAEDVRLVGSLSDDELSELYTGATVFVFPSLAEGFGIPAVEAMACGTSVVTSNAGSMPEVCGDAAVYVDPRDSGDLASAIQALIDKPERRSLLGRNGIQRAKTYRWEDSAKKLIQIFGTL
jgi:glycosyltransferase involved in cell wall biosynthesis